MKERPKLTVTTSSSGIQRRKNGRIRVNLEAYFIFNEKKYDTTILDIGTGGAALLASIPFYKGEAIQLYFNLGGTLMSLQGRITRTTGKIFVIKFDTIDESDASKIQLFINLKVYGR